MKVEDRISSTKVAIIQRIVAIDDPALLDALINMLNIWGHRSEPIPQEHLASINKGIAEADAGLAIAIEQYLQEMDAR